MQIKNFFSNLFGPSPAQLKHKVANLIAEGKVPEAIQVLLDAGHTEAALLKTRCDALHAQQAEGKMDWETFTIAQNRITFALLEMTKPPEAQPSPAAPEPESPNQEPHQAEYPKPTEEQCEQLLHLLRQDQMGLVLETTYTTELERIRQALAFLLQNQDS